MTKQRVIETDNGIQDEITVQVFDEFARWMRGKGWNGVEEMLTSGIYGGAMLEIGPGPGYVGLELVKRLPGASLTGCEISAAMLRVAEKNAVEYRIPARYVLGDAMEMPFPDNSFDSVISNGSMHEWKNPVRVFNEIHRVLRPGGRFCICDLRRDAARWKKFFVYASTQPKTMRPGLLTSLNAAYTRCEITELLRVSALTNACVKEDFFGLSISGGKASA